MHHRWGEGISIDRFMKRQVFGGVCRPGLATVMIEAYNVMQDRITRARPAGDPPDIMISPRLGNIAWFDFHRAEETIKIGAEAAERALDTIDEAMTALR
jgi:NTE family protein